MRRLLLALLLFAASGAGAQNIVGYEYWFNTEDQNNQRVFISAGNAPGVELNNLSIPLGTLALGLHKLHYRLKDDNGRWSSVISKPFVRLQGGPYQIVAGEYWFDQDYDPAPFSLGPGQIISANIDPAVSDLQLGTHKVHYRLRDDHGFWSSVISKPFVLQPGGPYELVLLRYWSDPEPNAEDVSDMTVVPITPNVQYLNIIDDVLFCNWSTTGQSNVYFQLKDNNGQWSSVITRNYAIDMAAAPPILSGVIAGPLAPPFGSTQTYTVQSAGPGTSYVWTLPNGWTGSSTTNSITVEVGSFNNGSDLSVYAINTCGQSEPITLDIATALNGPGAQYGITLFPNPTNGLVTITLPAGALTDRLLVLNAMGQVVRDEPAAQTERFILDLSGEADGIYTVRLFHTDGWNDLRVMVHR